jgi:hypothetical protein
VPGSCLGTTARIDGGMLTMRCTSGVFYYTAQRPGTAELMATVRPPLRPGQHVPAVDHRGHAQNHDPVTVQSTLTARAAHGPGGGWTGQVRCAAGAHSNPGSNYPAGRIAHALDRKSRSVTTASHCCSTITA